MKKTLYSLMLSDEVVAEIDRLAHKHGTNRSNLINQILAEYTGVVTPEQRINDIFSAIEQLLAPSRELVPFFTQNAPTMSMKSSLEYKYRPTVKYEVELYRDSRETLGELTVVFRTQSAALLSAMAEFFRIWKSIEELYLRPAPLYTLYDGKLVRSIAVPGCDCSADELAEAISEYIKLFDASMKRYLRGLTDLNEIGLRYYRMLTESKVHI